MSSERIWMWLAWHLPRRLVYFAVCRAGAWATTRGEGVHNTPDEVGILERMWRWNNA